MHTGWPCPVRTRPLRPASPMSRAATHGHVLPPCSRGPSTFRPGRSRPENSELTLRKPGVSAHTCQTHARTGTHVHTQTHTHRLPGHRPTPGTLQVTEPAAGEHPTKAMGGWEQHLPTRGGGATQRPGFAGWHPGTSSTRHPNTGAPSLRWAWRRNREGGVGAGGEQGRQLLAP